MTNTTSLKPLFPLGMIVSTPGALEACPSDYLTQCLNATTQAIGAMSAPRM